MVKPDKFDYLHLVYHFTVPLSPNPRKWLNKLRQSVGKLPTNCLSVFDHFAGLALKGILLNTKLEPDFTFMDFLFEKSKDPTLSLGETEDFLALDEKPGPLLLKPRQNAPHCCMSSKRTVQFLENLCI